MCLKSVNEEKACYVQRGRCENEFKVYKVVEELTKYVLKTMHDSGITIGMQAQNFAREYNKRVSRQQR